MSPEKVYLNYSSIAAYAAHKRKKKKSLIQIAQKAKEDLSPLLLVLSFSTLLPKKLTNKKDTQISHWANKFGQKCIGLVQDKRKGGGEYMWHKKAS